MAETENRATRRAAAIKVKLENFDLISTMMIANMLTPGDAAQWIGTVDRAGSLESQQAIHKILREFMELQALKAMARKRRA